MEADETSKRSGQPDVARSLTRIAAVAGAFCMALWLGLLVQRFAGRADDPLTTQQLSALKEQLRGAPNDEKLKGQIRVLDVRVRRNYFRRIGSANSGAWLLLAGGIVFLLAAKKCRQLRTMPYLPGAPGPDQAAPGPTRWAIIGAGGVTIALFLGLAVGVRSKLPDRPAGLENRTAGAAGAAQAKSDLPGREEFLSNWPQLRGPAGSGVCSITNVPLALNAESLVWKTPLPLAGFNSPIVWGNRVFLSAADPAQHDVLCFSAEDGKVLWRKSLQVPGATNEPPHIPETTGFAAATMATDGRRVYVIFANNDIGAFTLDGQLLWSKNLGPAKNQYGHAASLVTWQGRVIVQLDQGGEGERLSRLFALEGPTGNIAWQRPRPVPASWSTPLVCEPAGRPQIVTLGLPWVISYAAADGTELWRVEALAGEITPSPAFGAGLVFAVGPSEKLFALRPDGHGDITKTHIAWSADENLPDIASPAANDELVWMVSPGGVLTCFDAVSGKKQWEHDFQTEIFASPLIAAGRVYLVTKTGCIIQLAAARQFRELTRFELGETVSATPAFSSGRMFVRGEKHLACFAAAPVQLAKP